MKLTKEQIDVIDNTLEKVGIAYVDIRYELTDHVAAVLEESEGSFEYSLNEYMAHNKKQIRRANRKFIGIATLRTYKALLINMLKPWFFMSLGIIFFIAMALNTISERQNALRLLFIIFTVVCSVSCFPVVYNFIRKKKQYSMGSGYSLLYMVLLYTSIFMMGWQREIASDSIVMLYFSLVLTISGAIHYTMKQLCSQYKLRYHG